MEQNLSSGQLVNNQAQSVVVGVEKQAEKQDLVVASLFMRFLARVVDGVVLGIGNVILVQVVGMAVSMVGGGVGMFTSMMSLLVALLMPFVYEVVMVAKYGQTVGKMLVKIKVVNESGGVVSVGTSLIRWVVMIVPFEVLLAFFGDKKQALHDRIAKTVVVKV